MSKLFCVTNGNGGFWHGEDIDVPTVGTFIGTTEGADTWNDRAAAETFAAKVGGRVEALPEPQPTHSAPLLTSTQRKERTGEEPWYYQCVGDSDGEYHGYDHFVYDANGEEMASVPNERVGNLMAAAPALVNALAEMLLTFSADPLNKAQVITRNNAHAAIQLAADCPRVTPLEQPGDSVPELYRRWLSIQTDTASAEKAATYFNSVYSNRRKREQATGEQLAAKLLAENPPTEGRAQWAMIDGRLFLVRWEDNGRDPKRAVLDEQAQPIAYTTNF